jgi:hypothetical protein
MGMGEAGRFSTGNGVLGGAEIVFMSKRLTE